MNALSINQMEVIDGGGDIGLCSGSVAAYGGMLITIATLTTPIGWIGFTGFAIVAAATGTGIGAGCFT